METIKQFKSATKRAASTFTTQLLHACRGPLFLTTVSLGLLAFTVPAQATLLKGYIKTDQSASSSVQEKTEALSGRAESFPVSFAGSWKCITVVTGSGLASVPVGERLVSLVSFEPEADGRIVANWNQPGWAPGQEHVVPQSDSEASLDRTNYFLDESADGEWAARSHDHYVKVADNRMLASSRVDQYVAGQFMGSYQTTSVLYKLDDKMAYAR